MEQRVVIGGSGPCPAAGTAVGGVALLAILALVCDSVMKVIAAVIDTWYVMILDRLVTGRGSVSNAELDAFDSGYGPTYILKVTIYLVAIVAFPVWLFRVRTNAEILSPIGHRLIRPWVFLGWVIPVIWLWFPNGSWTTSGTPPRPPVAGPPHRRA